MSGEFLWWRSCGNKKGSLERHDYGSRVVFQKILERLCGWERRNQDNEAGVATLKLECGILGRKKKLLIVLLQNL